MSSRQTIGRHQKTIKLPQRTVKIPSDTPKSLLFLGMGVGVWRHQRKKEQKEEGEREEGKTQQNAGAHFNTNQGQRDTRTVRDTERLKYAH